VEGRTEAAERAAAVRLARGGDVLEAGFAYDEGDKAGIDALQAAAYGAGGTADADGAREADVETQEEADEDDRTEAEEGEREALQRKAERVPESMQQPCGPREKAGDAEEGAAHDDARAEGRSVATVEQPHASERLPRRPTKPRSAFLHFAREYSSQHIHKRPEEAVQMAAALWKAMAPERKQPYDQRLEQEKEQYAKDLQAYEVSVVEEAVCQDRAALVAEEERKRKAAQKKKEKNKAARERKAAAVVSQQAQSEPASCEKVVVISRWEKRRLSLISAAKDVQD